MTMKPVENMLDETLNKAELPIADDGFSDIVMNQLPRKRSARLDTRQWTLTAAATAGSIMTILLTPPIESFFGVYSFSGHQITIASAALLAAVVAIPFVWALNTMR